MPEKFNLQWNNFHTNTSKSFGFFRNASYLHDVTLVSDDFKQMAAHKLVLVACSEYFRNILEVTKQAQPILCLDGVNSVDLENILEYAYEGEVMICQDDLNRFLEVAQKLKLEGLMSNANRAEAYEPYNEQELEQDNSRDKILDIQSFEVKEEQPVAKIEGMGMSEDQHKQVLIDNVNKNEDGSVSCKVCGKLFVGSKIGNSMMMAKRHVEIHIEGLSYQCPHCDKKYRTRPSLQQHVIRNHKYNQL